jgi:pre-rRNA-processing protein TSR2
LFTPTPHESLLTFHALVARHSQFELALSLTLFTWPDLTLAVQNNWGGPNSAEKREWFAGAISELFPSPTSPTSVPVPELEDVESRLLQIMEDEFEVVVDDDSSLDIAKQILGLYNQTLEGEFGGVRKLQEEFERRGSRGVESIRAGIVQEDTDGSVDDEEEWSGLSDSDEDGDVEMGDAPPQLVKKERAAPEVDEDGFEKVVGKRKGR